MILELGPLPYHTVLNIIEWCVENDINRTGCIAVMDNLSLGHAHTGPYELELPDEFEIVLLLKWGHI